MPSEIHIIKPRDLIYKPQDLGLSHGSRVNTVAKAGVWKFLSPFILTVPCSLTDSKGELFGSIVFENLWQYSKVYRIHADQNNNPLPEWFDWRLKGFQDPIPHRYPMGRGRKPLYSFWDDKKLGYIEARKTIYATLYAENVVKTDSYKRLQSLHESLYDTDILLFLIDYDAYDHIGLNMTLKDVINDPDRIMGHAFVLVMMLTGVLEECLKP